MLWFDNREEALNATRENKGMLMLCEIERKTNGKYELCIEVASDLIYPWDDLTDKVFVHHTDNDSYSVREINTVDTNTFYADVQGHEKTNKFIGVFESFEKAYNVMLEILQIVEEKRKKVRKGAKKLKKWVVI